MHSLSRLTNTKWLSAESRGSTCKTTIVKGIVNDTMFRVDRLVLVRDSRVRLDEESLSDRWSWRRRQHTGRHWDRHELG